MGFGPVSSEIAPPKRPRLAHATNPSANIRTSGDNLATISNMSLATGAGLEPAPPARAGALTVKLPCNLSSPASGTGNLDMSDSAIHLRASPMSDGATAQYGVSDGAIQDSVFSSPVSEAGFRRLPRPISAITPSAPATAKRSRRSTVSRVPSVMGYECRRPHRQAASRNASRLIRPADRRIVAVLAGVIPPHAMIAERIAGRSHGEGQLFGVDRMAGVRPHDARIRCNRRAEVGARIRGSRVAPIPRVLLHLSSNSNARRNRPRGESPSGPRAILT